MAHAMADAPRLRGLSRGGWPGSAGRVGPECDAPAGLNGCARPALEIDAPTWHGAQHLSVLCADAGKLRCARAAKNKRMRLHFNKIGYSMYGKEQSRRVPSLVMPSLRARPHVPCRFHLHAAHNTRPCSALLRHLMSGASHSAPSQGTRDMDSVARDGGTRWRMNRTGSAARLFSQRRGWTRSE